MKRGESGTCPEGDATAYISLASAYSPFYGNPVNWGSIWYAITPDCGDKASYETCIDECWMWYMDCEFGCSLWYMDCEFGCSLMWPIGSPEYIACMADCTTDFNNCMADCTTDFNNCEDYCWSEWGWGSTDGMPVSNVVYDC